VSKVSAGEMSRSTGVFCSGVLGGRGLDLSCDLGRLVDFDFDLVEATEEEEMETFDAGRVEFEPLDELLLPTLLPRVFLVLVLTMVLFLQENVERKVICLFFIDL